LISINVLLVFAIVFTAFTSSLASSTGIEIQSSLKEADKNYYYASVFQKLIDSFPTELIQDQGVDRQVVAYPQDYAGAYIDDSNTLHIVLTKSAAMTTEANYQKIMDNDEDIIFETADFPLSRLYEIQRTLDIVMQEFGIESIALNEITNKIEIHLLDSTKEKDIIEYLKTKLYAFNDNSVIFKDPVGFETTAANTASNALGGSNTASTSGTAATLGFNAYRHATGQTGVVTAAHYATTGLTIRNAMGTNIGSASIRQFSGTVDAAFIPFPVGITWSYRFFGTYLPNEDFFTGYFPNAYDLTGMYVMKLGRTTGSTTGYVTSASASGVYDGITFTDQARVSNTQQDGDSGGPVFWSFTGPLIPGQVRPNIIVGIATFADGSNNGYVSKVENINNALGISPYHYNP